MAKKKDLKKFKNNPDLKGFEDILDMVSKPKPKAKGIEKKDPRFNDNFALLNLLEIEKERLELLKSLFDEKINNRVQFSQKDDIIKKQVQHRNVLREHLISYMQKSDSQFFINLDNYFKELL